MKKLSIEIWSDIACPWCYVGKRRLESALSAFEQEAPEVDLVWRAFELDAAAPRVQPAEVDYVAKLAAKYGRTKQQAQDMIDAMTEVAAKDGLDFRFDRIRPGNTFDAHRLLHFALESDPQGGLQDKLKERFMRGYLCEGEAIGEREALLRMSLEVGLAQADVERILETDEFSEEVRADEAQARSIGIRGVPFFVIGGKYAVSGAQPAELLKGAIERAAREQLQAESAPEGATCGVDGCS